MAITFGIVAIIAIVFILLYINSSLIFPVPKRPWQ